MAEEREKTLKILLKYVTDKEGVVQAKAALKDIEKSVDGTKGRLQGLTKLLDDDLAKSTGKWESRLQAVDVIGRKLETLGPAIGASWASGLGQAIGAGMDLYDILTSIKSLGGVGGLGKGLGALGGLSAGGMALAGILGAGAGVAGYEGLRRAGLAQEGSASSGQFASVIAYGAGSVFGEETAQNWFETVGKWTGEIAENAPKAEKGLDSINKAVEVTGSTVPKVVQDIIASAKQANAHNMLGLVGVALPTSPVSLPTGGMTIGSPGIARRNAAARAAMAAEQSEKNYEAERLKIIKASQRELLDAELDYQRERKQSIQQFDLETRKFQQDHLTEMRRIQEDSNRRLKGLAVERDGVSYLQEWESSQIDQKRKSDDFQTQQKQRKSQFDLQLAHEKQNFDALQNQRKRSASQQLDDLKASLSQEAEIKKSGYEKTLKHTRDFVSQMQSLFGQLSYGSGSIAHAVNQQIGQTLKVR